MIVGTKLLEVYLHLGSNQVQGLILGLVFSSRWLRIVCDTCHVNYLDTCHRLILIPLPHDAILLYDITMFVFVGRVGGKFKDLGAGPSSHPILDSPIRLATNRRNELQW